MEQLQEQFNSLKALWTEFEANHAEFVAKGNKKAAGRARNAVQGLKNGVTEYKKSSVALTKPVKQS
jgi:hypothetical protein